MIYWEWLATPKGGFTSKIYIHQKINLYTLEDKFIYIRR